MARGARSHSDGGSGASSRPCRSAALLTAAAVCLAPLAAPLLGPAVSSLDEGLRQAGEAASALSLLEAEAEAWFFGGHGQQELELNGRSKAAFSLLHATGAPPIYIQGVEWRVKVAANALGSFFGASHSFLVLNTSHGRVRLDKWGHHDFALLLHGLSDGGLHAAAGLALLRPNATMQELLRRLRGRLAFNLASANCHHVTEGAFRWLAPDANCPGSPNPRWLALFAYLEGHAPWIFERDVSELHARRLGPTLLGSPEAKTLRTMLNGSGAGTIELLRALTANSSNSKVLELLEKQAPWMLRLQDLAASRAERAIAHQEGALRNWTLGSTPRMRLGLQPALSRCSGSGSGSSSPSSDSGNDASLQFWGLSDCHSVKEERSCGNCECRHQSGARNSEVLISACACMPAPPASESSASPSCHSAVLGSPCSRSSSESWGKTSGSDSDSSRIAPDCIELDIPWWEVPEDLRPDGADSTIEACLQINENGSSPGSSDDTSTNCGFWPMTVSPPITAVLGLVLPAIAAAFVAALLAIGVFWLGMGVFISFFNPDGDCGVKTAIVPRSIFTGLLALAIGAWPCVIAASPEPVDTGIDFYVALGLAAVPFFIAVVAVCVVRGMTWALRLNVLLSTGDLSSDLLWALGAKFINVFAVANAFFITLGAAVAFIIYDVALSTYRDPKEPKVLVPARLVACWPGKRLAEHGFYQVFGSIDGSIEKLLANLLAAFILVLMVPLMALLALFLALLGFLLLLFVGVFLHCTRLLTLPVFAKRYWGYWGIEKEMQGTFDETTWHRLVISEVALESFPAIALNVGNMILVSAYDPIPIASLCFSIYISVRVGFKYLYFFLILESWPPSLMQSDYQPRERGTPGETVVGSPSTAA